MNRRLTLSAVASGFASVLLACSDAPAGPARFMEPPVAGASALSVSNGNSETSFGGFAFTCSGEPVNLAGTIASRWHITQLPSGDWMLTQHDVISAKGIGAVTGARVVRRGNSNTTQVFAAPNHGAFTFVQAVRIQTIVQGSADNDTFVVHAKWTVNAAGALSVDVFKVEFECNG